MKRVLTEIDCCCWFFTLLSIIQATPINHKQDIIGSDIAKRINFNGTNLEKVCLHENAVYTEGQNFTTTNPCEICICDPPGFSCSLSSCDLKPGCKAIHKANQCCPEYVCECERNGKIYGNGEKVEEPNPCKVCYCKGGEIKCTLVTCYTRDDCEPGYVAGVCCPKYDHCPPLETIKNKSSALMPAIVIISDLKTETASNKDHIKSLANINNHSTEKSTETESTSTESHEIFSSETSTYPSDITVTTMSLPTISPTITSNEMLSTINMDMIIASDDIKTNGDVSLDSTAESVTTQSAEMLITQETATSFSSKFTNPILHHNIDTTETQSESICTENSSEPISTTISEINEISATTPQEMDSTTAATEAPTEDLYSTIQYNNYTLSTVYNKNNSMDILIETTFDSYIGANDSSNGLIEFANVTRDSITNLDVMDVAPEDRFSASTPSHSGRSDDKHVNITAPSDEKSKRNIVAVTVPKSLKKDMDYISKNPGGPAPIVVMISAEQIQFLKLAEEPPIYVENRDPEDNKGAQDHLGIVVVPKTTPTTVEMVKVVDNNPYSESQSRDGDLNKAKTINNDFIFNNTSFIRER